jgi:predicted nucleic acid-binding protein
VIQSSFFTNPDRPLTADASAVINLNATRVAPEILGALPHPVIITENAWQELENGAAKGYEDAKRLAELTRLGLVSREPVGSLGLQVYEELITGTTLGSLDDGEAATIAYAVEVQGIALIDEAKAIRLCKANFPTLELVSTVELLLHPRIADCLGSDRHAQAMLNALRDARMSVPKQLLQQVVRLIGLEAAQTCPCLPRLMRNVR